MASFATDGRLGTQWGAAANVADQWLDVDLGIFSLFFVNIAQFLLV